MGDPGPRRADDRSREALRALARAGIELAGTAIGIPHMAALKALIGGPSPDSLVSLANQAQALTATTSQPAFEQLSQELAGVGDITSPVEKVGGQVLNLVPAPEPKPREPQPQRQDSEPIAPNQLAAIKREFERITQELELIGERVENVTRQHVLEVQLDASEAEVQAARVRLRKLMPEQLTSITRIFGRVVRDLYSQDLAQQTAAQEKLEAQYRQIVETHRLLVLAFDELEKKLVEARNV